jgi:hypothetical protein
VRVTNVCDCPQKKRKKYNRKDEEKRDFYCSLKKKKDSKC